MEWKYIAILNGNILLYGMDIYCYMEWKYTAILNGIILLYEMEIYWYEVLLVIYWICDGIYGINAFRDIMKDHGIIQMYYL